MLANSRRALICAGVLAVVSGPLLPALAVATAAIPAAPEKVTGIVETIIREPSPSQNAAIHAVANDTTTVLRVGTKIVPLTEGSLGTTKDGAKVSVAVVPGADGAKQVVAASTIAAPAALAVPAAPAAQQVYVALVLPAGLSRDASTTAASARAMVSKVSAYWSSQSGGNVSFSTAQVLPAYRSAYACTASSASTYNMWSEALRKMPGAYGTNKHLVLVAPRGADDYGCPYGLGSIGAVHASGNEVFVSGLNQSLLAHELGHNLGLYHSNSLRCPGIQDVRVSNRAFPGCQANPYDDLFDVMGYSGTSYGEGNLNAVHLAGMNLLPAAVRKLPTNSGVTHVRIAPLSSTANARTLRITDSAGKNYFVEYRTNAGRDSVASRNPYHPSWGVRVLRDDPDAPPSTGSYELDVTPTNLANDYNRSVPLGRTFTAASRRLTIKVTAADSTGASLTITNWASPIVPARVTLSVPKTAWVGATINATTRVTDVHGAPVAHWTMTLQRLGRGGTYWRSIKSVQTTSAGTASHRFTNRVSGHYRWVSASLAGASQRTSPSVTVTPTAKIAQRRPASSVRRGRKLSVHGTVSSVPAPVVYIQYRVPNGRWKTGPKATVKGTAVSGRIALKVRGVTYIRLRVKASNYVSSVSKPTVTSVT